MATLLLLSFTVQRFLFFVKRDNPCNVLYRQVVIIISCRILNIIKFNRCHLETILHFKYTISIRDICFRVHLNNSQVKYSRYAEVENKSRKKNSMRSSQY